MTIDYHPSTVSCTTCGNSFETRSTGSAQLKIETCSQCHPAYTGKIRKSHKSDQVDKFNNRYKK